jgi:hypothetical protein
MANWRKPTLSIGEAPDGDDGTRTPPRRASVYVRVRGQGPRLGRARGRGDVVKCLTAGGVLLRNPRRTGNLSDPCVVLPV